MYYYYTPHAHITSEVHNFHGEVIFQWVLIFCILNHKPILDKVYIYSK